MSLQPRMIVWTGAAALLLLPGIAMQFTPEVTWTASDFIAWGTMLALAGGGFDFLSRRAPDWTYRLGAVVALCSTFLLVWVVLAVGIVGSEQDEGNMVYAVVPAVAAAGTCIARFRAHGMARAMLATAGVQVLVAAVALADRPASAGRAWPTDVIVATTLFTALWLGSAALFGRSARAA